MIVMISPAKTMKLTMAGHWNVTQPRLLAHTEQILQKMRGYQADELAKLMKMNEKLGLQNYERFQKMDLSQPGNPAVFFYDGIQYKSMELSSLTEEEAEYLDQTVRILSGMYGLLRPFDGIWPYRLEMQQKGIQMEDTKDLYEYWREPVIQCLLNDLDYQTGQRGQEKLIVDLASSEYNRLAAELAQMSEIPYVVCIFKVDKRGILKVESTASKKARGQMVHFIAQQKAETVDDLKRFATDGYEYREDLSTQTDHNMMELVFVKKVL